MGMPQIPEEKFRPNLKEVFIDLVESIALEEMSLSHILNAEAEKIQVFIGEKLNFPFCSSSIDIIKFNQSVNQFVDTIVMKEWILSKKLDKVMQLDFSEDHYDKDFLDGEKGIEEINLDNELV